MMGAMEKDWARLGRKLADARGARTQQQIADELGVGRTTIQKIERGQVYKKVQFTHREYARLVGWTQDSPELVLAGGEPRFREQRDGDTPASREADGGTGEAPPDLSVEVREALGAGPLLKSEVVTVETPHGQVRATIVVRGEPDRSPDELRQALLAWRAKGVEDALRSPDDVSDSGA